jgi:hypothetical protein
MPTTEIPTSEVPGAGGGGGGLTWSRWLSASDLTLAAAQSVTIVSPPADVGDEITVVTRNLSGIRVQSASTCAIYTFDLASLDSSFDPAKDQLVDMQLEFSALPNACLVAIGPTDTATPTTVSVGQYYRPSAYHAIEMHANNIATRGTASGSLISPMYGNFISFPDWTEGVVGQIIGTTSATTTSGQGFTYDFGGASTSFAVLLGFFATSDGGDQVSTFKARFAVRDLTP